MYKLSFIVLSLLSAFVNIQAQSVTTPTSDISKGSNGLASLDIHLPVGVFTRTHFAGAGLNYSWSNHRFGMHISGKKLVGFTFNGGANYYFGKEIQPAGHDFRYGGYLYLHTMAGLLFNPLPNGNISLTAGPTMGIYKQNFDFGFGVTMAGSYYLTKNIAIGPGITYKKHARADALWAAVARVSFAF